MSKLLYAEANWNDDDDDDLDIPRGHSQITARHSSKTKQRGYDSGTQSRRGGHISADQGLESPTDWSDYEALRDLTPLALDLAREWNPPDSGITDEAFAAIMLANLHEEARLRRRNLRQEPIQFGGALKDALGDLAAIVLGRDTSIGIANMRGSEVEEIVNGMIPLQEGGVITFPVEGRLDNVLSAFPGFNRMGPFNDRAALEYLAADTTRGILRAQYYDIQPSIFNVSSWLTKGLQAVPGVPGFDNPDTDEDEQAIDHANRVLRAFESIIESDSGLNLYALPGQDFFYFNEFDEPYVSQETLTYLENGRPLAYFF